MSSAVRTQIESLIKDNLVMVFSKSYCPYCTKAKRVLNTHAPLKKYKVWEIENEKNCDEIQDTLQSITGGRSVPRVFINGKFIGGGDDTERLEKKGELKKLLEDCGAIGDEKADTKE